MPENRMKKRRGFVMTGGGAKGFYEAGVIHAFHLTGMDFDTITGSSIGAMNSIFYAEYLYRKRALPEDVRADPERIIETLDALVKSYHHAWFQMPQKRLIDDSEEGPLGKLKDDLLDFKIDLPQLTRIGWWWTDPQHGKLPPPGVWPAIARLGSELAERLGGMGAVLRILKDHGQSPFSEALRRYLARFGMEKSLVPADDDQKLASFFTAPVSPLTPEAFTNAFASQETDPTSEYRLVDPQRTLRDYAEAGIDVRLTRANFRTGRLEISTYFSDEDFAAYLEKQAWRLQTSEPESLPLGSFRLQVPGNPNAVNAALASGRFPGVFEPYPLSQIYDLDRPENRLLNLIVNHWLDEPEAENRLSRAYQTLHPAGEEQDARWQNLFKGWRESKTMRDFFPRRDDMYVDGGSIDNTPSNSAVDETREWADRSGISRRDLELDLYTIFLNAEPKIAPDENPSPAFYQVVNRTLQIQSAAKLSSDAVVVDAINQFGKRGSDLGQTLLLVLDSLKAVLPQLPAAQQQALLESLRQEASQHGLRGYLGKSGEDILNRMTDWSSAMVQQKLPVQVNMIKIYPDEMALDTLQFTERLGFRQDKAVRMITMGCYNTLWTVRARMENNADLDEQDQRTLRLARKWMGDEDWPADAEAQTALQKAWRCRRTACVFHEQSCAHGAASR